MPARKRRKIAIEAADHEQIRNESENATEKLLDVDYDPENAGLGLCTLANLFFIEKKYDQAEKKYLQAIDEGYDEAISGLIKVYRKTGRNDLAEKYLILSGELNQNRQCENYVEVGDLYFSEKKYTAAERYYLKAIAENYPEGYVGLGKVYTERKKYKDAQKNFLIAIEKGSTTTANFGLGNLAVKQKKYHDAEKYFTKALQNDYMPAALALGEMFTQLGVSQRAEYYLRIVGDETRDPKEMITIGDFYLKNKNADLARQ
jgi:tetratricopeptide (TPR) repeat protein